MTVFSLDLGLRERKVFSQNGEDGILEAIFQAIGTTDRISLEFGSDPEECCTRLLHDLGWDALCWDMRDYPGEAWFAEEMVTPGNINDLFTKYALPDVFDLLVIDVDGNDFHLWNRLRPAIRPRVVVVEFNSSLGLADLVTPIVPLFHWDGSNWFGASLTAMTALATHRGYTLVAVDSTGTNAFYVRNEDVGEQAFAHQGDLAKLFRPPTYGPNGHGHAPDVYQRPYQSSRAYL